MINRIVRYNTVQEQPSSPWSSSTAGIGIEVAHSSAQAQFRYTAWSLLAANGTHFSRGGGPTGFRDCQFAGGQFHSFEGLLGLTNCLWERVAGEYYTSPGGNGDPSRTTVDRYGNVWVGNRNIGGDGFGSVTKIGVVIGGTRGKKIGGVFVPDPQPLPPGVPPGEYLAPPFVYNTCVDRDRDGLIHTSYGLDNRLAWEAEESPQDEAILHYVRTTPTYVRSVAVDRDNNLWVASRSDGWQELIDAKTGAPITGWKFRYGAGGYGAVFDPFGVLWSAGFVGHGLLCLPRWATPNVLPETAGGILPGTRLGYGIGIDPTTADVWLGDYSQGGLWQLKQSGCSVKHAFGAGDNPLGNEIKGIVVDGSGNIWVVHAKLSPHPGQEIYRLRNTGEYRGAVVLEFTFPGPPPVTVVGKSPHGACIDSQGHVWAVCFEPAEDGKYYAMRIDPTQGVDPNTGNVVGQVVEAVDLGTFPSGQGPYNYSDMSGFVTLAATQPAGFWDFVQDSGADYTRWSTVTVDAEVNSGEGIIEVRAADRVTDLPSWPFRRLDGSSGTLCLVGLGIQGRYLEVRVTLLRDFGATQGPVLKGACVARGTPGTGLQITQHPRSAIVDRGGSAVFSVTATGTGLSYQWFKDGVPVAGGTGSTLPIQNAQFANAGKYHVRVSDTTGAFLDSADARLHVISTPVLHPYVYVSPSEPTVGSSVVLAATMDISPCPPGLVYYQWRKNGVPIPGANGLCDIQHPDYTATYSIEDVRCTHSGEYTVVFTDAYWKVANRHWGTANLHVKDEAGSELPTVTVTTSYPMPITDRHNPPTLTATACFAPICVQWYRVSEFFREPVPGANSMQYTLPNPVPCEMLGIFEVEVFDEGRFPHVSAPVFVFGDCEP